MAARLGALAAEIPGVQIAVPVETNGVFARIPMAAIAPLQERCFFYPWDAGIGLVRWMTSFDTTEGDVDRFAALLREVVGGLA
jgi:threonine aldolase